jgi:tetratricopeptide (TPR) repeat protein
MARNTLAALRDEWLPNAMIHVSRALMLMPEAGGIAMLICLYVVVGHPPLLALLAALLMLNFMVRVAALHLAGLALDGAHYREADALSQLALLLYPWSADAQALRGALALAGGEAEAAEASLRRAIALLPGRASFHAALSGALLDLGRPGEAAAAAREAVRLDRRYGLAHLYLAEAERAYGAAPELIEDRLRAGLAVTTAPEITAALQCALAGHLLAQGRMAEATLALRSAETLLMRCSTARGAQIRFHIGELLAAQGQIEEAREHFHGVEVLDPDSRYAAAAWRGARS